MRLSGDVFVGQSVNSTQSNVMEDGAFESLEEIEAQTIGDLLPDDDELLSGAIYGLGYVPHSNMADVEDDLFCSVGGMELESDDNFGCKNACEYGYGGSFNGQEMVLDNFRVSNIPHGQQSTRTIFVKNINGDIEDMELRVLFEVLFSLAWDLYSHEPFLSLTMMPFILFSNMVTYKHSLHPLSVMVL